MPQFFYAEPEVAGGFGENCILDRSTHPPTVSRLHYVFEGWLGDQLLESFPCYIVTERLANLLNEKGMSGFKLGPVQVTCGAQFSEVHPDTTLPKFLWLQVAGRIGIDASPLRQKTGDW